MTGRERNLVPSVFLIGYRGSGKSSVGRELARSMGRPFLDSDRLIEDSNSATIAEIFSERGEPAFRRIESEKIAELCERSSREDLVVATGGGAILDPATARRIRVAGRVVWLRAGVETLEARIDADAGSAASRPALSAGSASSEVRDVLAHREPLYRDASHLQVDTDALTPTEICAEIERHLKSFR